MATMKGYIDTDYLQLAQEQLIQLKRLTYSAMHIEPGHKVLDAGCGPGLDTVALAELVSPTGGVYGVDNDAAMIAEANVNAARASLDDRITHRLADANALPFDTSFFDACRSERLFQHLEDPGTVLAEMVRVTRPGGWIVVLDTDWGSGAIDTGEVDVVRRLVWFNAENSFNNGYAGRQLYRLLKQHGLADVSVTILPAMITRYPLARQLWQLDRLYETAQAAGVVNEDEVQRLQTSAEQADSAGVFFGYGCMMLAVGRRPQPNS